MAEPALVFFVLRYLSEEVIGVHIVVDATQPVSKIVCIVNQKAASLIREHAETAARIKAQQILVSLERSHVGAGAASIVATRLLGHARRCDGVKFTRGFARIAFRA